MIIAIIPAKGTSTRLPNKNMIEILGRPMIYYTINYAKKSSFINDIYVSTDQQKIKEYCQTLGIKTIHRPIDLCGETPIIDVYRHAYMQLKDKLEIKTMIGLQPDHPDRTLILDDVIKLFQKKQVHELTSCELNKKKNGAHYILSKEVLLGKDPLTTYQIIDDCTNVHFKEDLKIAEKNILNFDA